MKYSEADIQAAIAAWRSVEKVALTFGIERQDYIRTWLHNVCD